MLRFIWTWVRRSRGDRLVFLRFLLFGRDRRSVNGWTCLAAKSGGQSRQIVVLAIAERGYGCRAHRGVSRRLHKALKDKG